MAVAAVATTAVGGGDRVSSQLTASVRSPVRCWSWESFAENAQLSVFLRLVPTRPSICNVFSIERKRNSDVVARHRASIDATMAGLRSEMQLIDRTIDRSIMALLALRRVILFPLFFAHTRSVSEPRVELYLAELGTPIYIANIAVVFDEC